LAEHDSPHPHQSFSVSDTVAIGIDVHPVSMCPE